MKALLIRIGLLIIALNVINSVIVGHENNDIRRDILSNFQDKPKKELFKVYHFLFKKEYDLNSQEGLNRYKIFKNNLKFIETQNKIQNSYKLGINEFTDLTADEFRKTYVRGLTTEQNQEIKKFLNSQKESPSNTKNFKFDDFVEDDDEVLINKNLNSNSLTQTKIDWTSKMNPPNHQGICGSCWAFSTMNAVEGNYNVQFGNSPNFSQQQLVDCDTYDNACEGGLPNRALNYIKANGIAFYNDYPYISGVTNTANTCVSSNLTMNKIIDGFEECPLGKCTKETQRALLAKGPIVVYIDGDGRNSPTEGNSIFQHYSEGILDIPCVKYNHGVVLVGIDSDFNGEYLIGRNSWGSSWGENGNFRFRTRSSDNTCFMESYGILPIVKQTFNPVPPPIQPSCLKIYSECNLKGDVKEICGNTPQIDNFTKISGYLLGKYKSAKLYLNTNCKGSYYPMSDSNICLADSYPTLQNNIKSVIVDETLPPSGCVWLFDAYCISGNKVEICQDVSDLNAPQYNFGNKISSYKFGPGVKSVTIYLDKDYKGSYATVSRDLYSMSGSWMDKDIESIKIIK